MQGPSLPQICFDAFLRNFDKELCWRSFDNQLMPALLPVLSDSCNELQEDHEAGLPLDKAGWPFPLHHPYKGILSFNPLLQFLLILSVQTSGSQTCTSPDLLQNPLERNSTFTTTLSLQILEQFEAKLHKTIPLQLRRTKAVLANHYSSLLFHNLFQRHCRCSQIPEHRFAAL